MTTAELATNGARGEPPDESVAHPSRAKRTAAGRAAREAVSRSSHGRWTPPPERRDPVVMLEDEGATRVPELLPIRYGRMLVSPFTFYRGAAALMAADLADSPRSGLDVQLCGDAHLSNFGAFAAPDRRLTFSVNDFDETLPGPFEWDVKRLVASFAVAGRDRGFDTKQRELVNITAARGYREAMASFATMRTLDLWYSRLDIDEIRKLWSAQVGHAEVKQFERNVAKTRAKDSMRAFDKLTRLVDGQPRIVSDAPLIVPIEDLLSPDRAQEFSEAIQTVIRSYRQTLPEDRRHLLERFRYVHAARKVVGVGSVGTRAWIVLMAGTDESDPLFLQVKEAGSSVLEPYLGKSEYANHGQRVVEGQRLMQSASDIMLGWFGTTGIDGVDRDFYIRQLWDNKGSALVEAMPPRGLAAYANICAWTLARAHARSGDPVAIASYLGGKDTFDQALASFAERYADQNEGDYAALRQAVDAGRIIARPGL